MQYKRKTQNQGRPAKCSGPSRKRQKLEAPAKQPELSFQKDDTNFKKAKNASTSTRGSLMPNSRRKTQTFAREKHDVPGSEDDSEIDSDEAFGESDEERFEGFTFGGSSSSTHKLANANDGFENSERGEEAGSGSEFDSEESYNGIDEEPMAYGSDYEKAASAQDVLNHNDMHGMNTKKAHRSNVKVPKKLREEPSKNNLTEFSDLDASEGEVEDEHTVKQLHDLIKSMPMDEDEKAKPVRSISAIEMLPPSDHHMPTNQKITLQDLLPTISSSSLKHSVKRLAEASRSDRQGLKKLDAPLPKRQQDRLDRAVASQKAKETLNRWVETVKQNRRADHISFPLEREDKNVSLHVPSVQRDFDRTPATDLEATINTILHENGLKGKGTGSEKDLQLLETSEVQKLPIEEALARRARLRKMRDLLFREEIRAKRLKKIKSKAYRRVHRNERKQNLESRLSTLDYTDQDIDNEEKERLDRLRAEQRMSVKHRDSKWARDVRNSGRSSWDKETQLAMSELGDRQEQLRRRIEGKSARNAQEEWMKSFSDSDNDSDNGSDSDVKYDATAERFGKDTEYSVSNELLKTLDLSENEKINHRNSGALFQLTQRANKTIRADNDEQVHQLREELVSSGGSLDEDERDSAPFGRRSFSAKHNKLKLTPQQNKRQEFEECDDSDASEMSDQVVTQGSAPETNSKINSKSPAQIARSHMIRPIEKPRNSSQRHTEEINPWLIQRSKMQASVKPELLELNNESFDSSNKVDEQSKEVRDISLASKAEQVKGSEAVETEGSGSQPIAILNQDSDDEEQESGLLMQNQELINEAFAGDGVFKDFEKEKKAMEIDEADQTVDVSLPGWGSWFGEGISKKSLKRNQGKRIVKVDGIQADKRKDARLNRVIINEKRVRKNAKYLATTLPHPYETKGQYEKSLRLPVGREWSTSENFLNATKPRVLMKPNTIIRPLRAPMV